MGCFMGGKSYWGDDVFREYRREVCRKSQRKRRAFAKSHNLCRQCCREKAMPMRTLCPACLLKQREVQRRYTARYKVKSSDMA